MVTETVTLPLHSEDNKYWTFLVIMMASGSAAHRQAPRIGSAIGDTACRVGHR